MVLDPGIVFLADLYECPGCGVELDPPGRRVDSWLRCPRCGRPSEPPEAALDSNPWIDPGSVLADRPNGAGPIALGSGAGPVIKAAPPVLFVAALVADLVLRFAGGVDPMIQMAADVAAFLTFSLCGFLVLRAMIRP